MVRGNDGAVSKRVAKKPRTLDTFQNVRVGSPNQTSAALAVLNTELSTRNSRPRRGASKKAAQSIVDSIDPNVGSADEEEGEDFVPEDVAEEDEEAENEDQDYEHNSDLIEVEKPGSVKPPQDDSVSRLVSDTKSNRVTGGKRGRKPKQNASVKVEMQDLTPTSKLDNKRRVIRALKDLTSARDKIERIYGLNPQKLLGLAKVKEGFETGPFDFDLEVIQKESKYFVDFSPPCAKKDITHSLPLTSSSFHSIQESELQQLLPLRESEIRLQISDLDTHINTDQKIEFPTFPCGKRKGFVYNVGGLVTDMAWLSRDDTDSLFLAVSVSCNFDDPVDPGLRCFGEEEHISGITIFELDPQTLSFEKYQMIIHNFGETWNLKWHSGYRDEGSLGVLVACCQDGSVKLFKVDRSQKYEIRMVESANLSVSIPQAPISCFDFTSPDSIVCGFQNGSVAEFELGSELPSYYRKIHDSYIISIVAAYSNYEDTVISTTSVDGFICIFSPKSIQTTKCSIGRVRGGNSTIATYCPPVYGIVHSDGVNSVKAFSPRAAFATHQICQHENTVSSLAASKLHPFLLSGSADGTLMINNMARRFLTGIKNNATVYKYLKLWEWDFNIKEQKYRLDPNYLVYSFSVNEVSKARVSPHGINIACAKWNETSKGGKFYSFVNNAGLLVIEELGN
ncbi:LANO_0H22540g1_1 [Lachancea nothofagi CBS 11611]|uniref:LANO_0H22540g1_1 n=1 Tax=Lachancea nothofagi CBS 11611 TaxID=1266666 RepID=A0A1G4KNW2_9SACH|nr:LANO_0H22540g1_1 [Lachancea nothofagi CBS 11611]